MALLSSQMSQAAHPVQENSGSNHDGGICLFASEFFSTCLDPCWLLDSGATCHITCSLLHFIPHTQLHDRFVILPDKTRIPVHASGSVKLGSYFILHDVLYVPSFKVNLISVSALLATLSVSVHFTANGFLIQDLRSLKVIGKGDLVRGLYVYKVSSLQVPIPCSSLPNSVNNSLSHFNSILVSHDHECCANVAKVSVKTWHNRVGHVSHKVLHHLSNKLHCAIPVSDSFSLCDVCPLSKQKRLSFTSNHHMATNIFDLVHCDIWGPFHTATYHGK